MRPNGITGRTRAVALQRYDPHPAIARSIAKSRFCNLAIAAFGDERRNVASVLARSMADDAPHFRPWQEAHQVDALPGDGGVGEKAMTGTPFSRATSPAACTEAAKSGPRISSAPSAIAFAGSLARTLGGAAIILDAQADCWIVKFLQGELCGIAQVTRRSATGPTEAESGRIRATRTITVTDRLALRIRRKAAHKSRRAPAEGGHAPGKRQAEAEHHRPAERPAGEGSAFDAHAGGRQAQWMIAGRARFDFMGFDPLFLVPGSSGSIRHGSTFYHADVNGLVND